VVLEHGHSPRGGAGGLAGSVLHVAHGVLLGAACEFSWFNPDIGTGRAYKLAAKPDRSKYRV